MERALIYELIIRKAFNYDYRTFLNGADADLFRGLEYSYTRHNSKSLGSNESVEENFYEYAFKAGRIATYLENAVTQIIENSYVAEDDQEKLKKCKSRLIGCLTLHEINEIVDHLVEIVFKTK